MDKINIETSNNLSGTVKISGSKNSSLPILAATVLWGSQYKIKNVPEINDVYTMLELIKQLGGSFEFDRNVVEINTEKISSYEAPYELVKTMRASVLVWGALLGRFGKARISFPGGCAIGDRPIDEHIKAFESLGYKTVVEQGYLETKKIDKTGGSYKFNIKSVTGSENVIIASILADNSTELDNCSVEPEVTDLINFLKLLGADIKNIDDKVLISPVTSLNPENKVYSIIPDRIEAGTFAVLGSIPGNKIRITNCNTDHLKLPLEIIGKCGSNLKIKKNEIQVAGEELKPFNIETKPYPGFPTDLQAQFMVLAILAKGKSKFLENIFPSRFIHAAELRKLGADISVERGLANIKGVPFINAGKMQASDLRASASLVIAACTARGKSEISRVYHLDRGYEKIDYKLTEVGVKIWRTKE